MTQVAELVRLQRSWFQDSSATLWASILPCGVFRRTLVWTGGAEEVWRSYTNLTELRQPTDGAANSW